MEVEAVVVAARRSNIPEKRILSVRCGRDYYRLIDVEIGGQKVNECQSSQALFYYFTTGCFNFNPSTCSPSLTCLRCKCP